VEVIRIRGAGYLIASRGRCILRESGAYERKRHRGGNGRGRKQLAGDAHGVLSSQIGGTLPLEHDRIRLIQFRRRGGTL
jgi:hypothetical protein